MQFSLSSNSPSKTPKWQIAAVWLLRLVVGGVFVVSGFAKAIDPWGTLFKTEEYLIAWDMLQPRTLTLMAALIQSWGEFLLGALLLLGCYRRVTPVLSAALMVFMTSLTLYIWIADPVADCGCFGDLITLSNGATFAKNILIDLLIVGLILWNQKVRGVFTPYTQWMVGGALTIFVAAVSFLGYNVQPLLDFRRFPTGTSLLSTAEPTGDVVYSFIYEKNGKRESFTEDNLPDSTWTFVNRELTSGSEKLDDTFTILDDDSNDITADIIEPEGRQMLIVIPEIERVNPSYTYIINEIERELSAHDIPMVTLVSPDSRGIQWWRDISMSESPIYSAEPTLLKELVRGKVGLVFLNNGVVRWKRSMMAFDIENPYQSMKDASEYPDHILGRLVIGLIMALGAILFIDLTGITINSLVNRFKRKKA